MATATRLSLLVLALTAPGAVAQAQSSIATPHAAPAAEEETIELATLEVTSHPTGADERTAAVWVLHPDSRTAPATGADLIAAVPGVHVDRVGGAGGRSTLYLRGGEENHTLVLLDGVPLNDPTNSRGGGVDFSLIEPSAIGTIAVVRGPASMRHGPEGISGTMHLDTTEERIPGWSAGLEAGGDGFRRATFRSTRPSGRDGSRFHLGGTWHREQAADDAGSLRRVFLHGGYSQPGPLGLSLRAWHLDQDSSAFPDDSGGVRHAVIREREEREDRQSGASMRLGRRSGDGAWQITADAARLEAHTVSPGVASGLRDPAGLPASVDDIRLNRYRLAGYIERAIGDWALTAGADAAREEGRDDAVLDFGPFQLPAGFAQDRDRVGAFLEAGGPATEAITLSGGVRADHFDGLGTHVTGRLGLLGAITGTLQWRANAGTGFKAPSFYGLAHPLVGNPDLKPERGRSIDAGLRHVFAAGRGLVDLSIFANTLRDGVDYDPGPPPRIANVAEIHSRGAEAAATWRLSEDLQASGSVTYTDARGKPDDTRMRSRPRWRGTLALAWTPLPALSLDARLTGIDAVPESSIPTGDVMLPGWARVDLAAAWHLDEHWSVTLACDNLLDRRYEEAVGFSAPGRRLRVGVHAAF